MLNEQPLFVQPVVKPSCTIGLTTGCIHDTAVCHTWLNCMVAPVVSPEFVYKIPCKNCERVYVGETGRQLAARVKEHRKLECGPMPNVMVALPNIGGALCSTPQSLADAHY